MLGVDKEALFNKYCLDTWLHLLKQTFPKGQKGKSVVIDVHFRGQNWLKKYVLEGNMKV